MNQIDSCTKFCVCTGYKQNDFISMERPDESEYNELGMNINAFKKMLIKYDMEDYTEELIFYWYKILKSNDKEQQLKVQLYKQKKEIYFDFQKELTETLIFLLDEDAGTNLSISFQKSRNSITKYNSVVINNIINSLKKDYDKHNFNEEELTYDEAEAEIRNNSDNEWVYDYIKRIITYNPEIYPFEDNESIENFDYFNAIQFFLDENMIKLYANEHYTKREVTLDLLKANNTKIFKNKKKVGAKTKNELILIIGTNLSFLKRIDKYLISVENLMNIESIKLTNNDCRFIHDCLVFFNLIEDYSNKTHTKTTPEKYIYTTLNQHFSKMSVRARNEEMFKLKINYIDRIKKISRLKIDLTS